MWEYRKDRYHVYKCQFSLINLIKKRYKSENKLYLRTPKGIPNLQNFIYTIPPIGSPNLQKYLIE